MKNKDIETAGASEGNSHSEHVEITEGEWPEETDDWLASITGGQDLSAPGKAKKPVFIRMLGMENHRKYMDPLVVSLGPCHHGKRELNTMEMEKTVVARRFFENRKPDIRNCYDEVKKVFKQAREHYAEEIVKSVRIPQDFTRMMFLDGCFMAYFIEGANKGIIESELISREFPHIVRDMFLFENQIPFVVLFAIMKFRFKYWEVMNQILKFITRQNTLANFRYSDELPWRYFGLRLLGYDLRFASRDEDPRHLFDIIRRMLCGSIDERGKKATESAAVERYSPRQLGSVSEIKGDGIGFGRSNSGQLTSAKFVKTVFLLPRILLPEIVIDDTTKSLLINLIAFESCFSGNSNDMVVTSFIKFMKSLVRTVEDVKELRAKSILYHGLSSDQEVTALFRDLPISNASDLPAYINIERCVMSHRDSKLRVGIARWSSTYFGSRWTAVTSIAAALMIFLTAVQTIFSVFPRR